jgi:hypothetical protein
MAQRWWVVYAQAALERAEATLKKATQPEHEAITKQLFQPASPTLLRPRSRSQGPRSVGNALEVPPR